MKVRLALATCGTCHKPRGITHTCVTSATSKRRKTRTRVKPKLAVTCGKCGKNRGFLHTCTVRTDFAKRKRAAERDRKRKRGAARRREKRFAATERRRQAAARRKAAAKARKTAARKSPARPRPPAHDYHSCRARDCERYPCRVYREGVEDCPLPHGA